MGSEEKIIASPDMLLTPEIFDYLADDGSLGMPEDKPPSQIFIETEELKLGPQPAMVAFFCLFEKTEIIFQLLFGKKGGSINTLELLSFFIAFPIRSGDREQLEILQAAG
jgi:hypothetical protein